MKQKVPIVFNAHNGCRLLLSNPIQLFDQNAVFSDFLSFCLSGPLSLSLQYTFFRATSSSLVERHPFLLACQFLRNSPVIFSFAFVMAGMLPANPHTFLTLPFDIRHLILSQVLRRNRDIRPTVAIPLRGNRTPAVGWRSSALINWAGITQAQWNLMHACRQLYEESIQHVIAESRLFFNWPKDLYAFLTHIEAIDSANLNHIHYLILSRPTFPYASMALNKLHRCEELDIVALAPCATCRESRMARTNPSLMRRWRRLRHRNPQRRYWTRNLLLAPGSHDPPHYCPGCQQHSRKHKTDPVPLTSIGMSPFPAGLFWAEALAPPGRTRFSR